MELALSPEDRAFRDNSCAFIADNHPAEMRLPNPDTDLTKAQLLLWRRIPHKKGAIAPQLLDGASACATMSDKIAAKGVKPRAELCAGGVGAAGVFESSTDRKRRKDA